MTKLRDFFCLKRREQYASSDLIDHDAFRFATTCEQSRVDQNNSILALLLIKLGGDKAHPIVDKDVLAEVQLRQTDTAGLPEVGHVGILLPDTSSLGAWTVAERIGKAISNSHYTPEFDVLVYPDDGRHRCRLTRKGKIVICEHALAFSAEKRIESIARL